MQYYVYVYIQAYCISYLFIIVFIFYYYYCLLQYYCPLAAVIEGYNFYIYNIKLISESNMDLRYGEEERYTTALILLNVH